MRFAIITSIGVLNDDQRKLLHENVRPRWAKLVMAAIAFLLISGLINYLMFLKGTKVAVPAWEDWRGTYSKLYNAVFGIKFLIAMVIFFIASALAGRGEATKAIRANAKWWLTLNLALALTVVALSGILRYTHTGPTLPGTPNTVETGGTNG
jgi:hypothetical protein